MASTAPKQLKTVPKTAPQVHDADAEEAPPPKKKRNPLKLLLPLVLLLGAGGGGAWYFLHDQAPAKGDKAAAAAAKAEDTKPPVFAALEPFTVNLQREDGAAQYLQVGLSLKLADSSLSDAIKLHMPEIRNRVLLLLASKKASEISTTDGKQKLAAELMQAIAQPLGDAAGLEAVLFTSFVVQ